MKKRMLVNNFLNVGEVLCDFCEGKKDSWFWWSKSSPSSSSCHQHISPPTPVTNINVKKSRCSLVSYLHDYIWYRFTTNEGEWYVYLRISLFKEESFAEWMSTKRACYYKCDQKSINRISNWTGSPIESSNAAKEIVSRDWPVTEVTRNPDFRL